MTVSVPSVSISYKHFATIFFRRNIRILDVRSDNGRKKLPLLLKFIKSQLEF